jgi:small subunit ribosomal protein S16
LDQKPVSSTKFEEYRSNYMVRIRLRRTGKKNQASYRVVVADKEAPRDGRFIETIGHYNPRTDPPTVVIQADRALYWLSQGAQPSSPVARMLKKQGIMAHFEAYKRGEPLPTAEELAEAAKAAAEPEVEKVEAVKEPEATEATTDTETAGAEAVEEEAADANEAAEQATAEGTAA